MAVKRVGWLGGTVFLDSLCDDGTVTWPGNADSAITVTSYSTRGLGTAVGELSRFSSRGLRIDGEPVIDLAAPGNYDIRTCRSSGIPDVAIGSYTSFGGTSASAAHAAGAAALLLQANRALRHSGVKYALAETAVGDEMTGEVPNPVWGRGKIDALAAAAMAMDIEIPPFEDPFPRSHTVFLDQNCPNPFNPLTRIGFRTEGHGEVSLKIYDVRGRLVRVLLDRYLSRGTWEVYWDGTDDWGCRAASGVYSCRLQSQDDAASRKMLLLE